MTIETQRKPIHKCIMRIFYNSIVAGISAKYNSFCSTVRLPPTACVNGHVYLLLFFKFRAKNIEFDVAKVLRINRCHIFAYEKYKKIEFDLAKVWRIN